MARGRSKEERERLRRETEALRIPTKNRSQHDAARGVKEPTLAQLARELPSESSLKTYLDILAAESSDRSAAIMAAALVETALYVCVTSRMADPGEAGLATWFEGPTAPFGTFAAKIKLGRGLAIYGPLTEAALTRIKDIRNVFAHRSTPIDFDHPVIWREVEKLNEKPMIGERPARVRFSAFCLSISRHLINDAFEEGGKEIGLKFP